MHKTNGFLILLALVAVILLGFIAGKVAEPPQAAPTYTPWPTYTPRPTYTPYPTIASIALPTLWEGGFFPETAIVKNYPHVDGSTSTKPLQDFILCRIFELPCNWRYSLGYEKRVQIISNSPDHTYYFSVPDGMLPNIVHHGTHDAYVNLINGNADFILVARLPSADELEEAKAKDVTLDAQPVALDAFVMLAHAGNPVDSISISQIRGIYSGKLTNWLQVGGLDHPINAYQREQNSGSQELLKTLVMGNIPTINAPEMIVYTMQGPFNALNGGPSVFVGAGNEEGDPNGIGYSVYYYTWFIMGPLQNMKILAVEGVKPTSNTIANRTYPLIAEVYVVIRDGEPVDAPSVLLRDWLLTKEGQYVVEESGYVPITPPQ
ncbi:MAG: PstS family phosphate ABC transporter substrate-binding protein [Chloroflexota bacterium]